MLKFSTIWNQSLSQPILFSIFDRLGNSRKHQIERNMEKQSRRKFIRTGLAGFAGLTVSSAALLNFTSIPNARVDRVSLGNSGLKVSRIALGTGSKGSSKASNQTRLGMDQFADLAHHAYDRGISFFDMADSYGSHQYVGNAIKTLPREKITLLTKNWTHEDGSDRNVPVRDSLDRYRLEMGTDYIDIVLMHCLMQGGWSSNRKHYMEGLSKAKEEGIIKAVGVSCHNWD